MINDQMRKRYFNEVRFHHVVNAMVKVMFDCDFNPGDLSDALTVAGEKWELERVDRYLFTTAPEATEKTE